MNKKNSYLLGFFSENYKSFSDEIKSGHNLSYHIDISKKYKNVDQIRFHIRYIIYENQKCPLQVSKNLRIHLQIKPVQ